MENNNQRVLTIVIVATVLILVIISAGVTYAFFTANNPEGSTAQIVSKSGRMLINYNDGTDNIVPVTNIQPSNKILVNKTFTLTGTNTTSGLTMPYKVGIKYINGFSNGQLHYYIKRTNQNANITSNLIGTANQTIPGNTTDTGYTTGIFIKNQTESYLELATGEFKANTSNQTITFNLKIQFPDTGENQDSEKGASFTGNIVVNYENETGVDYITKLYNGDKENNGLLIDDTKDANIRYSGSKPNNYVEFANTGELWRIVGVFNVKDSSGKIERKIKLVRNESLGNFSWDATGNNNNGFNNWTEADLKTELNGDYLNTTLTANKTNWYNSYWDSSTKKPVLRQTGVFNYTNVIKSNYQNMISESVWNIGGNTWNNPNTPPYGLPLLDQYNKERGTITYQNSRPTEWTGKVGLIYASDYGYASTNSECRENLRAGVTYENGSWDYANGKCKTDNWLAKSSWYWTLSPYSGYSGSVFRVHGGGAVNNALVLQRGFAGRFLEI